MFFVDSSIFGGKIVQLLYNLLKYSYKTDNSSLFELPSYWAWTKMDFFKNNIKIIGFKALFLIADKWNDHPTLSF